MSGLADGVAEAAEPEKADRVEPGDPGGAGATGTGERPAPGETAFTVAVVAAVSMDLPSPYPVVQLREMEGLGRQLSFPIGLAEGTAIAQALRRVPTPRPLTFELLSDVLARFDVDVVAVRVVGRVSSVLLAELDLRGSRHRHVFSCRPSDAIALALQHGTPVPILVDTRLYDAEGDVEPL